MPTIRELRVVVSKLRPYHAAPHMFVQKGEYVRLPNAYPQKKKAVPVVGRLPDWRVDLQEMRFAELLKPRVQRLTRRERVVVRSVNEEYRRPNVSHCSEEPRSQLRRTIPAIPGVREDYDCPKVRLVFSHEQCEGASERVSNYCHVVRIYLWEYPQKSKPGKGIAHLPVFQQLELQFVSRLLPVRGELAVHQVDGICSLIRRQADAASEEEQEHISMASEDRSEYVSLLLV
jgi:hypothetical protein